MTKYHLMIMINNTDSGGILKATASYALKPETCSDWSSVLSLSDSVATS